LPLLFVVLLILLLIAFVVGVIFGLLLRGGAHRRRPRPPPPGPPLPGPAPAIPDVLSPAALADALRLRLAGAPADGGASPSAAPARVVWVDHGDDVLVHLDALQIQIVGQNVLVALDLETDQTGRKTLVVPFALAAAGGDAGLIAVTDALPRGNGMLVARWGSAVQAAVWNSLLSLAEDHASERSAAPRGLTIDAGALRLRAGPSLRVS